MNKLAGLVRTFAATAVLLSASVPAVKAQDVSEDQIKAARATIAALGVTNSFDNILPNLAERLKNTLIQASPNHQELITATVDDKALSLAGRRADVVERCGGRPGEGHDVIEQGDETTGHVNLRDSRN